MASLRLAARSCASRQRGAALITAVFSLVFVAGVITAATGQIEAMNKATEVEFQAEGIARSLSEAGLVDAYAWLRRQADQPVDEFQPRLDPKASPPVNETDDPSQGLVREFEIARGLWGRYVVARGSLGEAFTDRDGDGVWDRGETYTDADGNGQWTPPQGTRDVTPERGLPGAGAVWLLEAAGLVFHRPRLDLPLGEGPNTRLAAAHLATEARRLTIAPPAQAAICAPVATDITIGDRGRLRGSDLGIAYAMGSGSPQMLAGSEVETPSKAAALPGFSAGVESVFGVDLAQLKSMADISTAGSGEALPVPVPDFSLVVVEGDVTFDATRPLRGTGVLVVNGDVTIAGGSNSFFSGVIHASGDVTVRAPAYMRGTIIAGGRVDIAGTGGDYVEIEHDPAIISRLLTVMGQYRLSTATYRPGGTLEDGRPVDALGLAREAEPASLLKGYVKKK